MAPRKHLGSDITNRPLSELKTVHTELLGENMTTEIDMKPVRPAPSPTPRQAPKVSAVKAPAPAPAPMLTRTSVMNTTEPVKNVDVKQHAPLEHSSAASSLETPADNGKPKTREPGVVASKLAAVKTAVKTKWSNRTVRITALTTVIVLAVAGAAVTAKQLAPGGDGISLFGYRLADSVNEQPTDENTSGATDDDTKPAPSESSSPSASDQQNNNTSNNAQPRRQPDAQSPAQRQPGPTASTRAPERHGNASASTKPRDKYVEPTRPTVKPAPEETTAQPKPPVTTTPAEPSTQPSSKPATEKPGS